MNLQKLSKKVRRELTRNPKKTSVLALLALVACYFWAPLIFGWLAPDASPNADEAAQADATDAASTAAASGLAPATADAATQRAQAQRAALAEQWASIVAAMSKDPLTLPAKDVAAFRDPFETPAGHATTGTAGGDNSQTPHIAAAGEAERELTPQRAGIVLHFTVVGPRDKLARINGQNYREGESIPIGPPDPPDLPAAAAGSERPSVGLAGSVSLGRLWQMVKQPRKGIGFEVAEIHPGRVVLRRMDKSYTIAMPRPQLSPAGQLVIDNGRGGA